jgi:hypothetical protein
MPLVLKPSAFTCRAERLARAAASPHGSITRPSGKVKGVGPAPDPSEKVTLGVSAQFIRGYVLDASFVNVAGRDQVGPDQFANPGCGVRVDFVVVNAQVPPPHTAPPYRAVSIARCHAS